MEQYWKYFDQITEVNTEMTSPNQREHTSARGGSVVRIDSRGNGMAEDGEHFLKPEVIRGTSDKEPVLVPFMCSLNKEIEAVDTVSTEDPAEGDTIMVGVVGSAAPWFLTGWTNDVEVEFMIDTGCQVTILATCGSSIGDLVPVLSVSVARSTEYLPETATEKLPEYLEDIVRGGARFPGRYRS